MKKDFAKPMQDQKLITILLIEDDIADQELTKRAFSGWKTDNELRIVENGEAAIDYLLRKGEFTDPENSPRPDLILLDLNMPKCTGIDVLKAMMLIPELSGIPTVVLTTSKNDRDVKSAYRYGAKSYIVKPATIDDFISVAETLESYWFGTVSLPSG